MDKRIEKFMQEKGFVIFNNRFRCSICGNELMKDSDILFHVGRKLSFSVYDDKAYKVCPVCYFESDNLRDKICANFGNHMTPDVLDLFKSNDDFNKSLVPKYISYVIKILSNARHFNE